MFRRMSKNLSNHFLEMNFQPKDVKCQLKILLLILFFTTTISKDWYVSQFRGKDTNSGTKTFPFKTLTKAFDSIKEKDTIYLEAGIYKQNIRSSKSVNLIGVKEQGSIPVISGYSLFTSKSFAISHVNIESIESFGLYFVGSSDISIENVNFGPCQRLIFHFLKVQKEAAIGMKNVTGNVEISNILIQNSKGITISSESSFVKSVKVKDVILRNNDFGIFFQRIEHLMIQNLQQRTFTCFAQCGVHISSTKKFDVSNVTLSGGSGGFDISDSKGNLGDSIISNILKVPRGEGGGIRVGFRSELTTNNVTMVENQSLLGGGFYCDDAILNMKGGKIHKNKAKEGGAGYCSKYCNFFQVGVDIKENEQQMNGNCRGIKE
jgi:hypothetical protein